LIKNSDIRFGRYDLKNNIDQNLFAKVTSLINSNITSRSVTTIVPEVVYTISWINLKQSAKSDKTATFQLALVISYTYQKVYAIFNYDNINWDIRNKNVFIGFTDGKNSASTNRYSNNGDSRNNPSLIATSIGNSGSPGLYVYELINKVELDRCNSWYYNKIIYPSPSNIRLTSYFDCPLTIASANINLLLTRYKNRQWQKDTTCYMLNTNSFFRKKYQQFCCYDKFTGTLITNGPNSGFVYDSNSLSDIMNAGLDCCVDGSSKYWSNCIKFYSIYNFNRVS
jgi:hypothetical protein